MGFAKSTSKKKITGALLLGTLTGGLTGFAVSKEKLQEQGREMRDTPVYMAHEAASNARTIMRTPDVEINGMEKP